MLKLLNTIRDQWNPPRDRVLWAPVYLGAGIALYFSLSHEPSLAGLAGGVAAMTGIAIAAARKSPHLAYPALAVFLIVLGATLASLRTHMVDAPMLERNISFTRVEGRVLDISVSDSNDANADRPGGGRKRVTLDSLIIEKLPPEKTPASVRLSTYHVPDDVVPGDRIAVLARLMPPSGPVAPDGFNYRRQAFFEGNGASGFTMGQFEFIAKGQEKQDIWFNSLRQGVSKRISAEMPHPQSAVATALLAGERASIPDSINQDLRDSGLYHLLSISGLHVAIVCGVVFFVLRFFMALSPYLALHWPIKKIAAAAALLAGLFYSLLAGMPVPTQRSMLMTGLMLFAIMLDRSAVSIRTIALAAFFVLAFRPESLVGPSFQLSFAAVLAMVAFYEGAGRSLMIQSKDTGWAKRVFLYFAGIIITTGLVSVATLPPVLYHFGRLQIFGVIANMLAIPLTSFVVMPAGMAAMVLMPLHLEGPFLDIVDLGIQGTLWIAQWVAHMPHAAIALPSLTFGWYVIAMLGFLLVCFWQGWFRWVGAGIMVLASLLGLFGVRPMAMIDAEARSIGVKGGTEIVYMNKTPSEFVRGNWMSLWGGTEYQDGKPLKEPVWQSGDTGISCDDFACRVVRGKQGLSIVRSASVLFEECNWAAVIVALDKSIDEGRQKNCSAKIIPFWDIHDAGGIAFFNDGKTLTMRPMTPADERRPWTLRYQ